MSRLISLILIDDNRLSREGVAALVRGRQGFRLVAAGESSDQAIERIRESKPRVVLLNLQQEGDDSLILAGALHGKAPACGVIVMGLEPLEPDLVSFIRAGVAGFIMADASIGAVVSTIQSVARGIQVLPMELNRSLFRQLKRDGVGRRPRQRLDARRLTTQERAVAGLLVRAQCNEEMASELQSAIKRVPRHVHKVSSNLEVDRWLEVGTLSLRAGLIDESANSAAPIPVWPAEPWVLPPSI